MDSIPKTAASSHAVRTAVRDVQPFIAQAIRRGYRCERLSGLATGPKLSVAAALADRKIARARLTATTGSSLRRCVDRSTLMNHPKKADIADCHHRRAAKENTRAASGTSRKHNPVDAQAKGDDVTGPSLEEDLASESPVAPDEPGHAAGVDQFVGAQHDS